MKTDDKIEEVEAYCPKCEQIYMARIYWSGTGRPRKFCKNCTGYSRRNRDKEDKV